MTRRRFRRPATRIAALTLSLAAAPAMAGATLSLPLELGAEDNVRSVVYSCADGTELTVQYINARANALAIIPLAGEELIFVNVMSGSGARYVSGAREWWTKGDDATLRDEMSEAGPVECSDKAAKTGD